MRWRKTKISGDCRNRRAASRKGILQKVPAPGKGGLTRGPYGENGTAILSSGKVIYNSTSLKQVNFGGTKVRTSTPDPITIMSTGKSIGSWLGGIWI